MPLGIGSRHAALIASQRRTGCSDNCGFGRLAHAVGQYSSLYSYSSGIIWKGLQESDVGPAYQPSATSAGMSSTFPRHGKPNLDVLFPVFDAASRRVSGVPHSRTKILKSLATLANKYLNLAHKHQSNYTIRDEEMGYLRAIERGNIEEVRVILSDSYLRPESMFSSNRSSTSRDERGRRASLHVEDELPFIAEMRTWENPSPSFSNQTQSPRIVVDSEPEQTENRHHSKSQETNFPTAQPTTRQTPGRQDSQSASFNKNCCDEWGRTGLFIAISRRNLQMMDLLLQHDVDVGECLYHAIDFGYYDAVELLIKYDIVRDQVINGADSFYPSGLTPIQLAAHKNDFIMLKILHNHDFRIMGERKANSSGKRIFSLKRKKEDNTAGSSRCPLWDQANDRVLYYKAMASPAYLLMMHTEGGFEEDDGQDCDFLEMIFRLYERLKKKASDDPDSRSMYLRLAEQVEKFSCHLLDEIRSAEDLANFLRFDPPNVTKIITLPEHHLLPVQTACEVQMKQFVAHRHCQLALSMLRRGTLFNSDGGWKTTATRTLLALMFPILCLAYIIAPNSKIGSLLRNPMVNLSCHIASFVAFLVLMVVRLDWKWYQDEDCLGTPPTSIEIIILFLVLARTVNEIKRWKEARIVRTISDIWKINDMATFIIFYVVVVLRVMDIIRFNNVRHHGGYYCDRTQWRAEDYWPVLVSEGCMAFIYILIFVRSMEMAYLDRTFGPLQLSLDKMLVDVLRFGISFFLFTFFAFACAMAQLYWAYGRPRILRNNGTSLDEHCEEGYDKNSPCALVYASIHTSLLQQFWTIFGYGYTIEPPQAIYTPDGKALTDHTGFVLSGLYHCWAVIVMLNMLIAMMARSFDRVRDNAEVEWKFLRTNIWMQYIRKEMRPCPPPMNLIPSPRDIANMYYSLKGLFSKYRRKGPDIDNPRGRKAHLTEVIDCSLEAMRHKKTVNSVTNRYLRKHLLEEFQHAEDHQLLLQCSHSKSPSARRKAR